MSRRREQGPAAAASPEVPPDHAPWPAPATQPTTATPTTPPMPAANAEARRGQSAARGVDPDRAAAVMRRAAELQDAPDPVEPLDAEALVQIGRDLGLSPEAVRRAAAEIGAEAVVRGGRSGLLGPSVVLVGRVLDLDAPTVELRLAALLDRASFHPVRKRGGRSVWRQDRGVGARVATAVRHLVGRDGERGGRPDPLGRLDRALRQPERRVLADVTALDLVIEPIAGGGTVVRLTARLDNARRGAVMASTGGVATGALLALGGVAGALVGPDALLAVSGIGALVGGGAVAGARLAYGRTVTDLGEALDGLLDHVDTR